jgi:hypothetical protein
MSGGGSTLNDNPRRGENQKKLDFLARADVDDVTKAEVKPLQFGYGSDDLSIEELIADYDSGKGRYGIRRKNMQIAKMVTDRPGASQTNLALNGRPVGDVGMPSLVPGAIESASIIQDIKKQEAKKKVGV